SARSASIPETKGWAGSSTRRPEELTGPAGRAEAGRGPDPHREKPGRGPWRSPLQLLHQHPDDTGRCDPLRFGRVIGNNAVLQDRYGQLPYILKLDVGASAGECPCLGAQNEKLGGSRSGTPAQTAVYLLIGQFRSGPGGAH